MKTRLIASVALLAAGCSTRNQNSLLVITKVLPGTYTAASPTSAATCVIDPGGKELDFLTLNPAEGQGHVGLVVDNRLTSSVNVNSILRTETNDFVPENVVVDYEDTTSGAALKRSVTPALGGVVPKGAQASVGAFLFPSGLNGAAVGDFVRTLIHVEGKLLDGSRVSTSEREFIFQLCGTAGCSTNPCLL